jgi:threonine/homoserine/homoserine lactone efflux protein
MPVTWTFWSLFATSELLLCLTPGPAVLLVLSRALRSGTRKSIFGNLGILSANTVYFIVSATSVGALLVASYNLFFAVKWIGAAYLVVQGLRAIFGKADVLGRVDAAQREESGWRVFLDGFIVQISNPKAIVFFSALLPQFLDPHRPVAPQIAVLGVTSVVIEFFVLLFYGAAAGRATKLAQQPRYAALTNRLSGGLLIGAAAGLAALRRT